MESTKHFYLRIPFCVTRASVTFKSSLHQKRMLGSVSLKDGGVFVGVGRYFRKVVIPSEMHKYASHLSYVSLLSLLSFFVDKHSL